MNALVEQEAVREKTAYFYPVEILEGIKDLLIGQGALSLKFTKNQTEALQILHGIQLLQKPTNIRIRREKKDGIPVKCFVLGVAGSVNASLGVKAVLDERGTSLQHFDVSGTANGMAIGPLHFKIADKKISDQEALDKTFGVPRERLIPLVSATIGDVFGIQQKPENIDPRGEYLYWDIDGNVVNQIISDEQGGDKWDRGLEIEKKIYYFLGPLTIKSFDTGEVKKVYQVYGLNNAKIKTRWVPKGTRIQVNLRGLV